MGITGLVTNQLRDTRVFSMVSADICVQSIRFFNKRELSINSLCLSLLCAGRPTGFRCAIGRKHWIEHHELAHHAIGPAETVLVRIFPAAAGASGAHNVVFLDELAALTVNTVDADHPPAGHGGG